MNNSLNDLFNFSMTENLSVEDQELFTQLQSIMGHCVFDENGMTATPEVVNGLKSWMNQLMPDMSPELLNDFSINENIRITYDEITHSTLNLINFSDENYVSENNSNLNNTNRPEIIEQLQQYMESISDIDINSIRQMLTEHFNDHNSENHLSVEQVSKLPTIKFSELPTNKQIYSMCPISTDDFEENDIITVCPCHHYFKTSYITTWLTEFSNVCPYCKTTVNV